MHITTRTLLAAPPVLLEPVMMNLSDNGTRSHDTETDEQFQKFNPSTAIIIIVFVASFFFMGIFSLYISKCREDSSAARRRQILLGNGTVQYEATHRGLDLEVIESFPVFTYDLVKGLKTQMKEITECAVCLNNFEEDEQLRLLPKCGHAFHPECIDMWLSSHTTCPLCRTSLVPEDMSNPTGTEFGVIEPVIEPAEDAPEISIPIASTSRRTVGFSLPASREGSVRPSRHGSRRGDVKGPGPAQNVAGKAAEELEAPGDSDLSRSYSTGHSLVRLRKNMGGEKSTEWFISTPIGLTPASHKTCTYAVNQGLAMHSKSQGFNIGGSKFSRFPLFSKQFSFGRGRQQQQDNQEQNSGSIRRWYERRFRSERNSTEMDPALFRRSFSERTGPVFKPEGYNPQTQIARVEKEDDARAYILNLKSTLKRITGLEDESASSSNVVGASPVIAGGSVSERGIVKVAADL